MTRHGIDTYKAKFNSQYLEVKDVKVKLSRINDLYRNFTWEELQSPLMEKIHNRPLYDWNKLKDSIEKEGLNLRPLLTEDLQNFDEKFDYNIYDGNHRIRVLRELYGDDYLIELPCVVAILDLKIRFPNKTVYLSFEDYLKIETLDMISGKRKQELKKKVIIKTDSGYEK